MGWGRGGGNQEARAGAVSRCTFARAKRVGVSSTSKPRGQVKGFGGGCLVAETNYTRAGAREAVTEKPHRNHGWTRMSWAQNGTLRKIVPILFNHEWTRMGTNDPNQCWSDLLS